MADEDWAERHELQRQGIEVAKAEGRHLGRPKVQFLKTGMNGIQVDGRRSNSIRGYAADGDKERFVLSSGKTV
mgnify:FL=1